MQFNRRPLARILPRPLGSTALAALLAAAAGCTTPTPTDAEATAAQPSAAKPAAASPRGLVVIQPLRGTERLARSVHPLARPELDQGRLDPEKRISNLSLFFRPSFAQRRDRDALVAAQLDSKSPSFHKWLVPETYQARFGARPDDIARVTAWLGEQGFELHRTSPLGNRVTFSAKVGDLEKAFQTEMHRYLVGGKVHYAMATAPAMPSDLAEVVLGIRHTHDFFPKPLLSKVFAEGAGSRAPVPARPHFAFNYFDGGADAAFDILGPPDWAAAYDVAKLYNPGIGGKKLDGTGVTIAVIGTSQIAQSDIDAFRATFNLPQSNVIMTLVPDTGPAMGGQGGGGEAIIDVEWSGGIGKGATVNYVFVGADDGDPDDATIYLIEQNLADVMSESYGICEGGYLPSDADIAEEYGTAANIMGITYMAASGDSGATDCLEDGLPGLYVDMPGSFPGVTSIGGTEFPSPAWNSQGDLTGYPAVEAVWNESNNPYATYTYYGMTYQAGVGAGGGGISQVFARPAYQQSLAACDVVGSLPNPTGKPMRQTPDLSLSAASGTPGYFVTCTIDQQTGDCSGTGGAPVGQPVGGTSCASPSFAGVVAILNQAVGERLGNINPMLYELAASGKTPAPFHDITLGNNEVACGPNFFDAGGLDGGGIDASWPVEAGCGSGGFYGYAAAVGYDCASGIGSIDGFNLVSAWIGAAKTSTVLVPAPAMTTEGAKVTLTATVTVDTANANPVTGTVTYLFESLTSTGARDQTWELGSAAIANGTASSGTAVLSTVVPPGLADPGHQFVDVVAAYGGDLNHLASTSAAAIVSFAPIRFAIVPATVTLEPNGSENFTTTGGHAPIKWYVDLDTTAAYMNGGYYGSYIDETTGAFVAGPQAGYTLVQAFDKDGAEALAYVTVGSPTTPPPWAHDAGVDAAADAGHHDASKPDSGTPDSGGPDSGKPDSGKPGHDAGALESGSPRFPDAGKDSGSTGAKDAGHRRDAGETVREDAGEDNAPAGGGCGCVVAGGHESPGGPVGGVSGLLLGLGLIVTRRHARR